MAVDFLYAGIIALAVVLGFIHLERARVQRQEDLDLCCDTLYRLGAMVVSKQVGMPPSRVVPDKTLISPVPVNWDQVDVPMVPTRGELEDTVQQLGETRDAAYAMMKRRGLNPDLDVDVKRWSEIVSSVH